MAHGIGLGRNGADQLVPTHRATAMVKARQLAPVLAKNGGMSAREIAAQLGARWHAQTIIRMMNRVAC